MEVEKMTGTYVAPSLGMITVAELAPTWLSRKQSDVAASNYRTLESDAVKARRLASNPARGVENLPHKTGKRRVYLSADDVGRLAHESGQHRALVLTLAYTGQMGRGGGTACPRRGVPTPAVACPRQRRAARRRSRRRPDEEPQRTVGASATVRPRRTSGAVRGT